MEVAVITIFGAMGIQGMQIKILINVAGRFNYVRKKLRYTEHFILFVRIIGIRAIEQDPYSTEVKILWDDNILHLAKCVDYFYVEHFEVANG